MSQLRPFPVILANGQSATVYATSHFLDEREERLVRTNDGSEFLVPKSALLLRPDGAYELRIPMSELGRYGHPTRHQSESFEALEAHGDGVIPVLEEELKIEKREHETGRIRIHKSVETREARIEEPVRRTHFNLERVAIDRVVDAPVEPRYEGDTLVLPIYEEVLVVEKRLVLREEIRITRRSEEQLEERTIPVRREHIDVERVR